MKPERLRVGLIVRAQGLSGAVRVEPLTDHAERFSQGARLFADDRLLTVAESRPNGNQLTVRFREVGDRTAAELLAGTYLTLPLEAAGPLPQGSYYHFQLVGLRVVDRTGQELGRVEEVLEYPANDVLRVARSNGKGELLIPMVRVVVQAIEPDAGRIVVQMPEEVEA